MIETVLAPNPGPFTLEGTRSYVIDKTMILDPGPEIASHIEALLSAAPDLQVIVVSHRHADHAPATTELKRRTGAAVYAPLGSLEARLIDHPLEDGMMIPAGTRSLEAIATPGHTSEHYCFLTPAGDLFTGDTILGAGTTTIFPPDGHMGSYLASLRKLRSRGPKTIYPGHGPIRVDAVALIDSYIEHRLARERQILGVLGEGPADLSSLRHEIYPDLAPALERAAEIQLTAHLIHLIEQKRVVEEGSRFVSSRT